MVSQAVRAKRAAKALAKAQAISKARAEGSPFCEQVQYRIHRMIEWLAEQDPEVLSRLTQLPNPWFFCKRLYETALCRLRDDIRQISIEIYFESNPEPTEDEDVLLMIRRCLMMLKDQLSDNHDYRMLDAWSHRVCEVV